MYKSKSILHACNCVHTNCNIETILIPMLDNIQTCTCSSTTCTLWSSLVYFYNVKNTCQCVLDGSVRGVAILLLIAGLLSVGKIAYSVQDVIGKGSQGTVVFR